MSKVGKKGSKTVNLIKIQVDPMECPFREFRDHELSVEFWGMGPAQFRAYSTVPKMAAKPAGGAAAASQVWVDDQTQPLPRSIRHYLDGWVRAEDLAFDRWDCELVIYEENTTKMSLVDYQLSHAQVLLRSSFCRRVLANCFMLERIESLLVEHQWENFNYTFGPEGWRAKCHIYSPGMKAGGGVQHKPMVSKNGALLKLAVPDMNADTEEDTEDENVSDELLHEFDVMHSLTGGMSINIYTAGQFDYESLWQLFVTEVHNFSWDDDDELQSSTIRSKSTKKANPKDKDTQKGTAVAIMISDTKDYPPYAVPGVTPGHEMVLVVSMVRDVPLKKPLPEPEISLWKTYRWLDWARSHGLYEAYECPRTRFLKINGLMKLSYAPHLLDVQSTESITYCFREEQYKDDKSKKAKDMQRVSATTLAVVAMKEELREWVQYDSIQPLIFAVNVVYYPSHYQFTTAASNPPIKITKSPMRGLDIPAPKSAPLYLQIDGPEENCLKISLNMINPRILHNCGSPIEDFIEKAYLLLECFEWFLDKEVPPATAFVRTRDYQCVEVKFPPGRHYCRLWVHSRMNWHVALLSESTIILGTRDLIQNAASHECPWSAKFLNYLGAAFTNWIRLGRSVTTVGAGDKEFYSSYQPDLIWDPELIGYDKAFIHWMFRQALQSHLSKCLLPTDFNNVCPVLRRHFCDPDFGFPPKPEPTQSLRDIVGKDPCDCTMPEAEEQLEEEEKCEEVNREQETETSKQSLISPDTMDELLSEPKPPVISQVCELATEELPCGVLKYEREKVILKHEAATLIQSHWRGAWARKVLRTHVNLTSDVMKLLMDNAFGNLEMLSALMNEFFLMFPGTKYAYSISSALSGVYGLNQHTGSTSVTSKCYWIPYFQGVFYCHLPVKVHFDVYSTIPNSTLQVYDNDTGSQMPQSYNAHVTFDFVPNIFGYTVMGHGTLNKPLGHHTEAHWQLTVMTSIDKVFHVCDNHETELCNIMPLNSASKLHLEEIFIPNRRNILGGVQISVTRVEAVSFRAAASKPDLEMVATLRTMGDDGEEEEVAQCHGKGVLYWPYIRLKPFMSETVFKKTSYSTNMLHGGLSMGYLSARSLKGTSPKVAKIQRLSRSATKIHAQKPAPQEPKTYTIQVTAPDGWALQLNQWRRVDVVRNDIEIPKVDAPSKPKTGKEKGGSAKDKKDKEEKVKVEVEKLPVVPVHQPLLDDAFVELECSTAIGGGAFTKRDDERDLLFTAVRRSWDVKEPGRNAKGAKIREEFRNEFLVALPPPNQDSTYDYTTTGEEHLEELEEEILNASKQGPTPITESELQEMIEENEEESLYFTMPEQLRDKFIALYFVPLCTKERIEEESVLLSDEMTEAAKAERSARLEAALERMRDLQVYNEIHVLGRQKNRCQLLERLGVDAIWNPELATVLEERDEAIAKESLDRQLSAVKKKQEAKQTKK